MIPEKVRQHMGLEQGQDFLVVEHQGYVCLKRITRDQADWANGCGRTQWDLAQQGADQTAVVTTRGQG